MHGREARGHYSQLVKILYIFLQRLEIATFNYKISLDVMFLLLPEQLICLNKVMHTYSNILLYFELRDLINIGYI